MQILHKVRQERTSARPTQQHPTFKMQPQQKVEGMDAVLGMQEDRRQI